MSSFRLPAVTAGLVLWALAGCHRLPNDRIYLDLAQTPPTVRAALAGVYKPAEVRSIARSFRHGQAVYRVMMTGPDGRQSWVELNPAGDQIGSG